MFLNDEIFFQSVYVCVVCGTWIYLSISWCWKWKKNTRTFYSWKKRKTCVSFWKEKCVSSITSYCIQNHRNKVAKKRTDKVVGSIQIYYVFDWGAFFLSRSKRSPNMERPNFFSYFLLIHPHVFHSVFKFLFISSLQICC